MIRKLIYKYGVGLCSMALYVGIISTNAMCRFCFHQPEVPNKMKDLLKNKF